ncbi:hypothetical protein DESUT3_16540 [Desulfuromonas versatilis]|uniref:Uncharacterized protein n=1 Tax=Desulfuromonas versatilis TaxID=2802975 RepID=A0ABN6DX34_9BACT|nr:hypothetical protein [Desulfuromonas versatilis]BCR04585.1 hypothetical protein DESUT3_16540 [Desulfuromonas versatilis]
MPQTNDPREPLEHSDVHDKAKGATEKIWDATLKTFHQATFRANQYKRLAQKKIDLASLHKKISATYSELGQLIDERREAGDLDVMNTEEVRDMLRRLDSLKQAAATLEAEKDEIKAEHMAEEGEPPTKMKH